ncbi:MAG: Fused permease/ATPase component of ABC transporter involved in Fe-S cluster assembly [Candidatus Peregrinibacteria bacterium GW2011_GWA2_44_7]|nr:MAG: Fused permease/ATPase component of ABC transporter involved in Fe-S cluster assembly [Candidatus Peregrinibacteria bacterium GW2011_GWA2_44_7]
MASNETIVRFENVNFNFGIKKPILDEVNFSVREGMKITIMGQNGAGKSTIFKLMTEALKPEHGKIHINRGLTVATLTIASLNLFQEDNKRDCSWPKR